jgi:lipopolysaccharide/colanic/teichoic acid biosynthesis glycosyltransferase
MSAILKRVLDVVLSLVALVVLSPILSLAAFGVWLSDRSPILYRARLTGRNGRPFTMYKLRTMRVNHGAFQSVITADQDPRVFRFGAWLRRAKVDELPQLVNILRGDMSIVGPRPQHPDIVRGHYGPEHRELLAVRPGLTSPGTLYDYAHADAIVGKTDPERSYVERLLPLCLALDLVYVRRASLGYDAALVARTIAQIVSTVCGRPWAADPPELSQARRLLGTAFAVDTRDEPARPTVAAYP